jgi:hypothetical protein
VTKFSNKTFSVSMNSDITQEEWDRIFKKRNIDCTCPSCERISWLTKSSPVNDSKPWTFGRNPGD